MTRPERRHAPRLSAAPQALHDAAFPDGLAHIDDPVPQENQLCRGAVTILRAPEHAPAIAAIGLPAVWLAALQKAEKERAARETRKKKQAPPQPATP